MRPTASSSRPARRFLGALAIVLTLSPPAAATSQGPMADGAYVGTLPCADCAGIRTELTLFTLGPNGRPDVYRLRSTYLGTRDGDRTEERMGPWLRLQEGGVERLRLDPYNDDIRQSFRRQDETTLVLLDRSEQPIRTLHNLGLVRDGSVPPAPRADVVRQLFRGTLKREADQLVLTPCAPGRPERVRDVSVESTISAVLADLGFDRTGAMYVEAFGQRREGALMFERLNRAGVEMRCPPPGAAMALRAQGNEPGWALVSSSRGVSLSRTDPPVLSAPPVPTSWRWRGGRSDRAEALVTTSTEGGALAAVLTPRICRDTMARAAYGFTAVVSVRRPAATELKGCGYLGNAMLP